MSDEPFYSPNKNPYPPGKKLFAFLRGHDRYLCELQDFGWWGTEAQFFQNEEFLFSRRFPTWEQAVQWAEEERTAIERGGS
jgi:hypothetical protein